MCKALRTVLVQLVRGLPHADKGYFVEEEGCGSVACVQRSIRARLQPAPLRDVTSNTAVSLREKQTCG